MSFIKTADGASFFYKNWGPKNARPIVLHHGWPPNSDDWDAKLMFFLSDDDVHI
jgi:non-heme chloroperoxidase